MRYGVIIFLLALLLGGLGILLGQTGFEIASIFVALIAVCVFLWASLRLSMRLRPPAFSEQGRTPENVSQPDSLDEVIFAPGAPQGAVPPEKLSEGEYHYGGWDENRSLPENNDSV